LWIRSLLSGQRQLQKLNKLPRLDYFQLSWKRKRFLQGLV
jgi:hypothetical protein